MSLFSFRKHRKLTVKDTIAGLDIGTSKVSCGIARLDASGKLRIIGYGHQASRGLKAGMIIDMEALTASVVGAIHAAEEMAEETLQEVFLGVSPAITKSHSLRIEANISGHAIDATDLKKISAQACQEVERVGNHVIHMIPMTYDIDNAHDIKDPRGMFGETLRSSISLISSQPSILRNFVACIERCHLGVAGFVSSSYASGLATLVEDEFELGTTVIDMGAGTTSIAVFHDSKLYYTDTILVGGAHVTADIARGFSTPMIHAERLKALYGSAMVSSNDEREKIVVPQIGEDENHKGSQITRGELVRIVRPRIEETFELIRDRMKAAGVHKIAGKRLVITGGASQLAGAIQLANLILEKQGRLGKPLHLLGLEQGSRNPMFSACAGLIMYGKNTYDSLKELPKKQDQRNINQFFGQIGSWLRENL